MLVLCYKEYYSGKRTLVGYEIRQSLEVKIRDMSKIGTILDKGVQAGANDVSNLRFTIDNEEELKKQARGQAVEKAKNKAKELSSQLGVSLGKIVSFSENYNTPYYKGMYIGEGMGGADVPSIEAGENKITIAVTITYEIY